MEPKCFFDADRSADDPFPRAAQTNGGPRPRLRLETFPAMGRRRRVCPPSDRATRTFGAGSRTTVWLSNLRWSEPSGVGGRQSFLAFS
jgi:hypothetical protein